MLFKAIITVQINEHHLQLKIQSSDLKSISNNPSVYPDISIYAQLTSATLMGF
jgi:hypothetical protein